MTRRWHLDKRPDLVLAVLAIGLTIVFGIASVFSPEVRALLTFLVRRPAWLLLAVVVTVAGIWILALKTDLRRMERKLASAKYTRFETIQNIRYGHVEYFPFLYYRHGDGAAVGIGVQVLHALLDQNGLVRFPKRSSWGDMIDGLCAGDYDIIATPLFETRERSQRVAFSSPIFFADIGIYVRSGSTLVNRSGPETDRFDDAIKTLSMEHGLRMEVISGELSEKMARKYLRHHSRETLTRQQATIPNLITGLTDDQRRSDVVFAERFVAERTPEVIARSVVNILRPGELLYPVAFAIRREDYVLRNYINIKLMQLEDSQNSRILGFIVEELQKHDGFGDIDLPTVEKYFVRQKLTC